MKFWQKALICVVGVLVLGNASGVVTFLSIQDWYASLERPPGTPPNGVFGPVWTALYVMMGFALARIWHLPGDVPGKGGALKWFGIQMVINLMWTPAFFGFHRPGIALVIILLLLGSIGITIARFLPLSRGAGWLLVPYFAWVGYATYLNAGFWWLNR